MSSVLDRLREKAHQWEVAIENTRETAGAAIGFGVSRGSRVVLKIIKQQGDEWRSGETLRAFAGHGTVRVYEYDGGAVLLERLDPGDELVTLVRQGNDEEAIEIMAQVLRQTSGYSAPANCPTVLDWADAFERYLKAGRQLIPQDLIIEARDTFLRLAASQQTVALLHGDLQHYNVLFDSKRGWVAIDPKGVVGEDEYEIGAILRNPSEMPDLFTSPATIQRRLEHLTTSLNLAPERVLGWAFAQAVLSAIWDVEDGHIVRPDHSALRLAQSIKTLLPILP